jgi:hypothetical protein
MGVLALARDSSDYRRTSVKLSQRTKDTIGLFAFSVFLAIVMKLAVVGP